MVSHEYAAGDLPDALAAASFAAGAARMNGPAWTRDEDAALVRLAYQGTPYTEIAAQLERTFAAVAQRICRLRHGRPIDKDRRGNATTALRIPVGISRPMRLADFGTAALP